MKRLFGLLLVFVVSFSLFAHNSFAQADINRQSLQGVVTDQETKASLEAKGVALFTTFIAELQTKQANPRSVTGLSGATDAQVAAYVQGNKDLVAIVTKARTNFSTVYNASKTSPNIYANLTASLQATKSRLNEDEKTTPTVVKIPMLRAEVSVLSKRIDDLSQEKQRDLINNNQPDQAVEIQKAVPAAVVEKTNSLKSPDACSIFNWSITSCISETVTWLIKSVLLNIAGFALWLTTEMFSYVMRVGVLEFKTWAPDALYPIWILVRQMVSLGVVFIGLYLGFLYIVGTETGKAKFAKYLPWVAMFALFVNFSYPIARFAVDVSNVVSLSAYTAAFGNDALTSGSASTPGAIVLSRLGLTSLIFSATQVEGNNGVDLISQVNSIPGALLTVIFVLYAAYVFFMATALIIVRTIALVSLTVISPFLFIDSILPVFGDKAQQVRKVFFEQLAVGPVFLILLTLTLKFVSIFADNGALGSVASLANGTPKDVTVFFNIFMMLVMLHLTLKITKSVAGELGQTVTNFAGKVGGFATGAASGGVGLLARGTIGRQAMKLRNSDWVEQNQNKWYGRRVYDMSNALSKSSFDLRSSSVVAKGAGMVGLGGSLQAMGKGRQAGYEEAMEERRKEILARGARIKTRYERDVTDSDGNILHRKGDVNVEAEAAYNRYVAQGGGALFMTKDQKELAKEALSKQAEEKTAKEIAEIAKNAEKEFGLYNNAEDTVDPITGKRLTKKENQKNFVKELRKELQRLSETGVNLQRDTQAQSIISALNMIEKARARELETENKKMQNLLEQFERIGRLAKEGEKETEQAKFLAGMDKETFAAFNTARGKANQSTVDSGPSPVDIDLDREEDEKVLFMRTDFDSEASAQRSARQADAVMRANAEMENNYRSSGSGVDLPENHNPKMDDVAGAVKNLLSSMRNDPDAPSSPVSGPSGSPRNPSPPSSSKASEPLVAEPA